MRNGTSGIQRLKELLSLSLAMFLAYNPLIVASAAASGPENVENLAGDFTVSVDGTHTQINSHTEFSAMGATKFDIPIDHSANISQPTDVSTFAISIESAAPTHIDGSLTSNAFVVWVNPAGVFIGDGASVDVAGLIAAAGSISREDLISGNLDFDLTGPVENLGNIDARVVALLGNHIANHGVITATDGLITLVAGDEAYLNYPGQDGYVKVDLTSIAPHEGPGIVNTGTLDAGNGVVNMAAGDFYSLAMSTTGTIRADHIALEGGEGGTVEVGGSLDASNTNGDGGSIHVTGDDVVVADADIDASGTTGGGEVLIGGDWQGGGDLATASSTSVDADSSIRADATENGDGGKVVVWSNDATSFEGAISARGGADGGNGGQVEVSGSQLAFAGTVDTRAPAGETGSLLLDPTDLVIAAAGDIAPATIVTNLESTGIDLSADNDITVAEDVLAGGNTNSNDFGLFAGRNVNIDADISVNGSFTAQANDPSGDAANRSPGFGNITMADGTLIDTSTGNGTITLLAGATPMSNGDANGDGVVGVADATILAEQFGNSAANGDPLDADFNSDGVVGLQDRAILTDNFGRGPGTVSTYTLEAGSGDVAITAADVNISSGPGAQITTLGNVSIANASDGTGIQLGSEIVGKLSLTDLEIDQITADSVTIGSDTAGDVTVTANITPANTSNLEIRTGGAISGGFNRVIESNLVLAAGTGIQLATSVDTLTASTSTSGDITIVEASDITLDSVTTADGSDGSINVDTIGGDLIVNGPVKTGDNAGDGNRTSGSVSLLARGIVGKIFGTGSVVTGDASSSNGGTATSGDISLNGARIGQADTGTDAFAIGFGSSTNQGSLVATSDGGGGDDAAGIFLVAANGDLNVDLVQADAGSGDVTLEATNGAITDGEIFEATNISADDLTLVAESGIGAQRAESDLNVAVNTLTAQTTGAGDIVVTELDDVILGPGGAVTSTAGSDIIIVSGGEMTVTGDVLTADATSGTTGRIELRTTSGDLQLGTGAGPTPTPLVKSGDVTGAGDVESGSVTLAAGGALYGPGTAVTGDATSTDSATATSGDIVLEGDRIGRTLLTTQNFRVDTGAATTNGAVSATSDGGSDSDGLISLVEVTGDLNLGSINASGGDGDVRLAALTGGAITDGTVAENANITGNDLLMSGFDGVGAKAPGADINTDVDTIEAGASFNGDVVITEANNIEVISLNNSAGGDVVLGAGGDIDVSGAITTTSGSDGSIDVSTVAGDITVNGAVQTGDNSGAGTRSTGSVTLSAGTDGEILGTGTVQTGAASSNDGSDATSGGITLFANRISQAKDANSFGIQIGSATSSGTAQEGLLLAVTDGGAGDAGGVFLTAAAGNINLDAVNASGGAGNASLEATNGAITDGDAATESPILVAADTVLQAATGIGAQPGGGTLDLDTSVDTLVANTTVSGDIVISEFDSITLGNSGQGISTNGGDIRISSASGPITIAEDVTTADGTGGSIQIVTSVGSLSPTPGDIIVNALVKSGDDIGAGDRNSGVVILTAFGTGEILGTGKVQTGDAFSNDGGAASAGDMVLVADRISQAKDTNGFDVQLGSAGFSGGAGSAAQSNLTATTDGGPGDAGGVFISSAAGNLNLDVVTANGGTGNVVLEAAAGFITNGGQSGDPDVVANDAKLVANNGIGVGGLGSTLRTDVATLVARTTSSGDIVIIETDAITLGNAGEGISTGGSDILINAGGPITVAENVTTADGTDGRIELFTPAGDITVNALVKTGDNSGAGPRETGSVTLNTAQSGEILGTGTVQTGDASSNDGGTATSGDIVLEADRISQARDTNGFGVQIGSATSSGTATEGTLTAQTFGGAGDAGGVFVTAAAGNLNLDVVRANGGNGNVSLEASNGAITDGTAAELPNLLADDAKLVAATGIGAGPEGGTATLDTVVTTLVAQTTSSGDIYITENDAITLGNAGEGISTGGSDIVILSGGPMTIAENVTTADGTNGRIDLTTSSGDITVNALVKTGDNSGIGGRSTGNVEITAGDTGEILGTGKVQTGAAESTTGGSAVSGDITFFADRISQAKDTSGFAVEFGSATSNGGAETEGSLRATTDGGAGDVGGIFVTASAGNLNLDTVNATAGAGNVVLEATTGAITDGTADDNVADVIGGLVTLRGAANIGDIFSGNGSVDVEVAQLDASSDNGSIFIDSANNTDLNLGIVSAASDVLLDAGTGAINDATVDDTADNVTAAITSFRAGSIGQGVNGPLAVAGFVQANTAASNGNISIERISAGDMGLGGVNAGSGNVVLNATAGAINDGRVRGATIDLDATNGIGNASTVTVLNDQSTSLSADSTNGDIDLDGDGTDTVTVTSLTTGDGSITYDQGVGSDVADVDFALVTTGDGSIALSNDGGSLSISGPVTAGGTGNVTLVTTATGSDSGGITLGDVVTAEDDRVTMTSAIDIIDANDGNPDDVNIRAAQAVLRTTNELNGGSIGEPGNFIETELGTTAGDAGELAARSEKGGIFITQSGDLNVVSLDGVNGLSSGDGDVALGVGSELGIEADLVAGDSVGGSGSLFVGVDGGLTFSSSDTEVSAADDVVIDASGLIDFGGVREITAGNDIFLNDTIKLGTTPETATMFQLFEAPDGEYAFTLNAGNDVVLGINQKLTVLDSMQIISGGNTTVGDLAARDEINIAAAGGIFLRTSDGAIQRNKATVLLSNGTTVPDAAGLDIVANVVNTNGNTPVAIGTGAAPGIFNQNGDFPTGGTYVVGRVFQDGSPLTTSDLFFPSQGDPAQQVLDLTGKLEPNCGGVCAPPPLPEEVTGSGTLLSGLNSVAAKGKPLWESELVAFLECSIFDEDDDPELVPEECREFVEKDVAEADPRFEIDSAQRARETYRDLFAEADDLRDTLQVASDAYRATSGGQVSGPGFRKYVSRTPEQAQAKGYLDRLGVLEGDLRSLSESLNSQTGDLDEWFEVLIDDITPIGMSPEELRNSIQPPATARLYASDLPRNSVR